jgi:hypothetical protein
MKGYRNGVQYCPKRFDLDLMGIISSQGLRWFLVLNG